MFTIKQSMIVVRIKNNKKWHQKLCISIMVIFLEFRNFNIFFLNCHCTTTTVNIKKYYNKELKDIK